MADRNDCDEYDICSDCGEIYGFYRLTEQLVNDIKHLEKEIVRLRYALSRHLPEYDGKMLRCEIFSDLSGCSYEQPAYKQYVSFCCGGQDPLDCNNYCKELFALARGEGI
jgi:hypothetical protein